MIRIGILGKIGSGKTFVAKRFDIQYLVQMRKSQKFTSLMKKFTINLKKNYQNIFFRFL